MGKIDLKLLGIVLVFGLVSIFGFGLVAGCDEAEMQTMMTGDVVGVNDGNLNLGYLSLIKELLITLVLLLLVIYLIKLIGKK